MSIDYENNQKKLNAILPQQLLNIIAFKIDPKHPKHAKQGRHISLVSLLTFLFISSTIGVIVNHQLRLSAFQIPKHTAPILSGLSVSISGADFLSLEDSYRSWHCAMGEQCTENNEERRRWADHTLFPFSASWNLMSWTDLPSPPCHGGPWNHKSNYQSVLL